MRKFVSLCVLSFNRQKFLQKSLESLYATTDYPFELIVHDDGSSDSASDYLIQQYKEGKISYLILNGGTNMGVGHAFNACVNLAHGDYIFKLDQDLEYKPNWLSKCVPILDEIEVGAMGLFHYDHDPVDQRKMLKEKRVGYEIHEDFVGSAVGFRKDMLKLVGKWDSFSEAFAEDYVWKMKLKSAGFALVLPNEDLVTNYGFGFGNSTVVAKDEAGNLTASKFVTEPKVFLNN
jgi:glycosyltransferase involved in cell wall biosynthesis